MSDSIVQIDGSQGEGGGQMVRSSLALALVTGRGVEIKNIRAKRQKPGLMQQQLTAVRAAAEIGNAEVEGDSLGSQRLCFRPGKVSGGNYTFKVGTAGSATLVFQTVLPALLTAPAESHLVLEGGTHNSMAPPYDFLDKAFLPLVNRMGPAVVTQLFRPGFYPAGGGRFAATVRPAPLARLELTDRGKLLDRRVRAVIANLPSHIGQRECDTIFKATGWELRSMLVEEAKNSPRPGQRRNDRVGIGACCRGLHRLWPPGSSRGRRRHASRLRGATSIWRPACPSARTWPISFFCLWESPRIIKLAPGHSARWPSRSTALTHIDILHRFLEIRIEVRDALENNVLVHVG